MPFSTLTEADAELLQHKLDKVAECTANFLGYPVSKDFDYSELMPFLQYPMNNLGDPFVDSTYAVDSREMEKEVVEFFAKLFRAKPDDWWGYVTNGGSEGNLYGLYLARELHPKGMVYYSESTHYSVQKNLHLLNMPNIVIRSQENGEIDYEDLQHTIRMNRHMPAIILANTGTTMTEARDDVKRIKAILKSMAIKHHYIHVDGALSGSISPFIEPRPACEEIASRPYCAFGGLYRQCRYDDHRLA
jgi:histidine decarboxylase